MFSHLIITLLLLLFDQIVKGYSTDEINYQENSNNSSNYNETDQINRTNTIRYDDYIDNEIDMKQTYRSGIEKFLQGFQTTFKSSSSSPALSFPGSIILYLPDPLKSWFSDDSWIGKSFGDVLNTFRDDFHAIFPGTLWCGDGNVAQNTEDVGVFSATDICCKQHDSCPFSIEAGKTRGLLKNNGIFTRSACSCDLEFYKCLKKVDTVISSNIGTTYFNILRPQCFGYHYPIKYCDKYDNVRRSEKKCSKYELDYDKNKTLEWYDLPDF